MQLGSSAGIFYGYIFIISLLLWGWVKYLRASVKLVNMFCVYGECSSNVQVPTCYPMLCLASIPIYRPPTRSAGMARTLPLPFCLAVPSLHLLLTSPSPSSRLRHDHLHPRVDGVRGPH